MRWDRFFDDLEMQLASEWEAERAALDTEAERLRLSRLVLRERLSRLAVVPTAGEAAFELSDGTVLRARVGGVGSDCVALDPGERRGVVVVVPLSAVVAVSLPHRELAHSARPGQAPSPLSERLTFGYVLRDLVRRRVGVAVRLTVGRSLTGTIDRAGADHLDLAVHDAGAVRRADAVTGHRIVPFGAISWVRVDGISAVL